MVKRQAVAADITGCDTSAVVASLTSPSPMLHRWTDSERYPDSWEDEENVAPALVAAWEQEQVQSLRIPGNMSCCDHISGWKSDYTARPAVQTLVSKACRAIKPPMVHTKVINTSDTVHAGPRDTAPERRQPKAAAAAAAAAAAEGLASSGAA